jgi:hypothetical protein
MSHVCLAQDFEVYSHLEKTNSMLLDAAILQTRLLLGLLTFSTIHERHLLQMSMTY